MHRSFWKTTALLVLLNTRLWAGDPKLSEAVSGNWFETHIRPVLATKCLKCHGEDKQEADLRLDSLAALLQGGQSGPAIVRGEPDESLLIEAIKYESLEMPPTEPLSTEEIRAFEAWIAHDAPWPKHLASVRDHAESVSASDRAWWAFQPLVKPPPPVVDGDDWSRNPIDRFVHRRLVEHAMRPAPRAKKAILVRRLYFDLWGLPPSPEQVDAFLQDDSPTAWERLIDKLLADPRYGEHWARHWLDLVRYAESDGWNQDAYRSDMGRYRDYVVKSLNDDTPYPKFVRQQLAGDEMPADDPENLAATGFLRLGIYEYNQRDARSHWDDIMNEITDVTGDVFFGMGMACARCHDHKFDPLLQTDYFSLRAFFEPIIWRDDIRYATRRQLAAYEQQLAEWEAATRSVRAKMNALLQPYHDRKWTTTVDKFPLDIQACFHKDPEERTSWEHQMAYLVERQFEEEGGGPLKDITPKDTKRYEALQKELAKFDHVRPKPLPSLMTVTDFPGAIAQTVIPDDPGEEPIEPGFPTVLTGITDRSRPELPQVPASSGRRTSLAQWIGQDNNPLTSRVVVNRIWQHHFGRGIVPTANDFGQQGQRPTHPELLDWLTASFVERGWSFKYLHRLILTSATWQLSAFHPRATEFQQKDPGDSLLWRASIRRLSAEQIRDAMLAVSGELVHELGGPSVDGSTPRRSLYVKRFRNTPNELLHAFDVAHGLKSVAQRHTTTTPTQSLLMMNGDFPLERAKRMMQKQPRATCQARLRYVIRSMWGREPTEVELRESLAFLGASCDQAAGKVDPARWGDLFHVLLNSNEFLYVD